MKTSKESKPGFSLITFSHTLIHIFPATLAPLLPLIRAEFGLSYTKVGIVTFVLSLCWAFSGIPAGVISGKIDRIKMFFFTFLVVGTFAILLSLVTTFLGVLTVLILLFLSVGFFHPPAYSFMTDRYTEKKGRTVGIFEVGGSTGILVAPLIAGVVGSWLGWRCVYTLWALPAFVTAFLFYQLFSNNELTDCRECNLNGKGGEKEVPQKKSLSHYPYLKTIYLTQGFFGFIAGGSISFLPLFLTDVHGFEVSSAGGILTLFLAGSAAGKMVGGRYSETLGAKKMAITGFLISCFFLLLIPFMPGFLLSIILFPAGVALSMILPGLFILVGETETSDLGLAYGIQLLAGAGLGAVSRLLCGIISDVLGIQYIFFFLAGVGFLATIFAYRYLEKAR